MSSQIEVQCPPVSLADVLSSDSKFWQFPSDKYAPGEVPLHIQQNIIEAFHLKRRCNEELLLLKSEMHNVINYWNQRKDCIKKLFLQLTEDDSQFNRGSQCLLKNFCGKFNCFVQEQLQHFLVWFHLPDMKLQPHSMTQILNPLMKTVAVTVIYYDYTICKHACHLYCLIYTTGDCSCWVMLQLYMHAYDAVYTPQTASSPMHVTYRV